MQLSTTTIPVAEGRTLFMSNGCYLVQTSDKKNILIDSGLPPDYVPPLGTPPSEQQKTVLEHLAELRVPPDDISMLICSHFDVDHAGYHDAFPNAEFIVQRAHYTLARSGQARYAGARAHWDQPNLRYRLVEGDTELAPGLMLLETSGHAPGHQSVLVRLPRIGPILLAIDAVVLERLFTPDRHAWLTDDSEDELRASTQKLLDLVTREQVALVIFGHDGQQWRALKKAPEFYD
jgi:N-acyl homoserine lactone hydrolase